MSDTTVPNVGMAVPLSPGQAEPQQVQMHYVPPVDVLTGPRIADALERIAGALEDINAKFDGLAHPEVPQEEEGKYTIYVSCAPIKDELAVIGAEVRKGGEQIQAFTAHTNKDVVHSMLLAIYSCIQQIALRNDTDKVVDIVTDVPGLVDTLDLTTTLPDNTLSLVEQIISVATRFGIRALIEEPTHYLLANVIQEIMTERNKVCSQLQAQESSTKTQK